MTNLNSILMLITVFGMGFIFFFYSIARGLFEIVLCLKTANKLNTERNQIAHEHLTKMVEWEEINWKELNELDNDSDLESW